MQRLLKDAQRLLMPAPEPELLAAECARLVGGERRAVVRLTITRGSGGRAYRPPADPAPRRIVMRRPWPSGLAHARRKGIVMHTSPVRLAVGGPLVGMKHGNRLEQVLAAEHARRDGVDEAVLLDAHGRLVEAIAGNVVLIVDGEAITPSLSAAGVAGVGMRALVERLGANLAERAIDSDVLRRAESLMVINSVAGIRPARRLDDRELAMIEPCHRWQRLWEELFECKE